MISNVRHLQELQSPFQTIKARVEIYNGSTLEATCTCDDVLKSFSVEKEGEGKFFGFGVCHKLSMALMGQNTPLTITKAHSIKVAFGVDGEYLYPYPTFQVHEIQKDAETDEITLVAYDALYKATEHSVEELSLPTSYSIFEFASFCAQLMGTNVRVIVSEDDIFDIDYPEGANFEGSETLREALNAVAEATQTIFFLNNNNELIFKRLDKEGAAVWTISRENYSTLKNSNPCVLGRIVHATELGDNVATDPAAIIEGETQYIRDNPFWTLRDDVAELVERAQAIAEGYSITPFDCEWFGNYLLEIGDKIDLVTRNGAVVTSYLLSDGITYNGSLSEVTGWAYEENEAETSANPTSLGEALSQTFAKVDKASKEVQIQAGKVEDHTSAIAALQINTESITASVSKIEEDVKVANESANEEIANIKQELSVKATPQDITIEVRKELESGVDKVVTSTGFRLDENGLSVSQADNEINTQISHDGMNVYRQGEAEAVLVANSQGVSAENLHATTYLIIGSNSRFEDYDGGTRTGCFWIGS